MAKPTANQRLNCMTLAGTAIDQRRYIKHYRGSMVAVILEQSEDFPTLTKFKGQPDSLELRNELKRVFGFSRFDNPDWLCNFRARNDIEKYATGPEPSASLWARMVKAVDGLVDGMDP